MNKGKTQEELSYGNEMFQKGYKAGFDRGKSKARKGFLEFLYELNSTLGNDVDRLLTKKIKELQNSGAKE